MNKFLFLLLSFTIFQCTNNSKEAKNKLDSIVLSADANSPELNDDDSDSIPVEEDGDSPDEVNDVAKNTLEELKRDPKSIDTTTVPSNPRKMVATFESTGSGDYFHLNFIDEKGNEWEFGNGNNNLKDYEFSVEGKDFGEDASNPKLKGKKFEITWDSVTTIYACCSGEPHGVKGRVPTILDLKLME